MNKYTRKGQEEIKMGQTGQKSIQEQITDLHVQLTKIEESFKSLGESTLNNTVIVSALAELAGIEAVQKVVDQHALARAKKEADKRRQNIQQALTAGYIDIDETISITSLIEFVERQTDGTVIEPGYGQVMLFNLPENLQQGVLGHKVGDRVTITNENITTEIEVIGIYKQGTPKVMPTGCGGTEEVAGPLPGDGPTGPGVFESCDSAPLSDFGSATGPLDTGLDCCPGVLGPTGPTGIEDVGVTGPLGDSLPMDTDSLIIDGPNGLDKPPCDDCTEGLAGKECVRVAEGCEPMTCIKPLDPAVIS